MVEVTPTAVVCDGRALLESGASVLALPVFPGDDGPWVGAGAAEVTAELGVDVFDALERESATGKAGKVVTVPGSAGVAKVLLVGVGDGSSASYRQAGAAGARSSRGVGRVATTGTEPASAPALRPALEGDFLAPIAWRARGARA